MAVTTASTTQHRTVEELRDLVVNPEERYGDLPSLRRLLGDIERLDPDASELDDLTPLPAASTAEASDIQMLDIPLDPDGCERAADLGAGGHRR
jgi:hypothetical protein